MHLEHTLVRLLKTDILGHCLSTLFADGLICFFYIFLSGYQPFDSKGTPFFPWNDGVVITFITVNVPRTAVRTHIQPTLPKLNASCDVSETSTASSRGTDWFPEAHAAHNQVAEMPAIGVDIRRQPGLRPALPPLFVRFESNEAIQPHEPADAERLPLAARRALYLANLRRVQLG